eukprot:6087740-Ditylum_brightwellii.AAC.1
MDERAKKRKVASLEFKELKERQKEILEESSGNKENWSKEEEERMKELWGIMRELRPPPPPSFDNEGLGLPF